MQVDLISNLRIVIVIVEPVSIYLFDNSLKIVIKNYFVRSQI